MSTQVTLNISNITNNGVPCKSPVVLILGTTGEIAFPCGDKIDKDGNIKLTLPTSEFANNCIQVVVKCDECGHCPEQERTICLCSESNDCPSCETCIEGICQSKCLPDEFCKDNTCVECDENNPCPKGFICINGKCVCLGKINDKGECVQCTQDGDCSQCESCQNNQCIEKVCPNNLTCISGDCSCPPGTKYDVVTNSCIPVGCDNDSQCGECETCVGNICQPIICPEGYICQNGNCIYWPCSDTTCNNGADCGENCGCLNGECVPCYLLECTGECAQALGCKCNTNTDKCEPVDNCGDYCDGSTPCLDPGCTCYNNVCVSCENFPCIEGDGGCDSYYNCGCTNGDCGGGKGCNDKLELKKIENCPTECALEATYTTENNCGCDPIEFRVKNIKNCNLSDPRPTEVVLNLEVKAYKNGRPYENYLDEITIGDDELMSATLLTTVKFFTKNASGAWVAETVNAKQVESVSALGNAFNNIIIDKGHLGFSGILQPPLNRKAEIEVRVSGVDIENNNCRNYAGKVIANYSLDFTSAQITCNAVETYKAEVKTILTDNDSIRRPLFIWSKSNTGTFSPTKYEPSTSYNNSGWFRKEYGEKIGNVWKDKVSKPIDGLWNNLNYKVTVDCGCKSNTANLEKVVFCCPTKFNYNLEQCGRKITVLPFPTCEVNRKLEGTLPKEVQTFYYVSLNGVDYLLRPGGGHLLQNFVKELEVPITSIVFSQRYEGTPLVAKACDVEYTEEVNAPDFGLEAECGKLTVTQLSGTNPITGVKIVGTTQTFTKVSGQNKWELVVPKNSANFKVATTFQNLCVFVKEIDVVCEPKVEPTPTSLIAKGECPSGGTNPNITLDAVAGFVGVVEFNDPRTNTWVDGVLSGATYKTTFNNFVAGTYTFTARQKTNNAIVATTNVTIEPPVDLVLTAEPACGAANGKLKLTGVAGSTWSVTGAGFLAGGTQVVIPPSGFIELQVLNANAGGTFTAAFVSDGSGKSCGGTKTIVVPKEGGVVTATIEAPTETCKGAPISFRVNDGGLGLTYNISGTSGVVFTGLNGGKIVGGQYATATYSGIAGSFTINATIDAATSGCYTATITSKTITANTSPIIVSNNTCSFGEVGAYNITAVWNNRPGSSILDVITYTVGNSTIELTNFPALSNVYVGNYLPSDGFDSYTITATFAGCTTTVEVPFVSCDQPNNCPPLGEPTVVANPQYPCGIQAVNLIYSGGVVPENGDTYTWIDITTGLDVVLATGAVTLGSIPNQTVTAELNPKNYKLRITKNSGACPYESTPVEVQAQSSQNVVIYGPGILPDTQTLTSGVSYTFFTDIIPGATYNWVLTNPGGSTTNLGTSFQAITSLLAGASVLTVTVTVDGCTYTKTENLVVGTNCAGEVSIALTGTGSDECKNVSGTVANIVGTVSTWAWKIDGTTVQSGSGIITNLNTSILDPGVTVDITLEVTTSAGCLLISDTLEYNRCSCLCNTSSICTTELSVIGVSGSEVTYTVPAGHTSDLYVWFQIGGFPDKLKIVRNSDSAVLLNTRQAGIGVKAINSVADSAIYLSYDLTTIAVGDDISTLVEDKYTNCTLSTTSGTISPVVFSGVTAQRSNNFGGGGAEVGIYILIPESVHGGSALTFTGTPFQVEPCFPQNAINAAGFIISCEPIAAAGTI